MAQSLKKQKAIANAKKGAKTKAKKRELERRLMIHNMASAGIRPEAIALALGEDLQAVLKTLRLLTFAPNPVGKAIGIGASIVDTGIDLARGRFGITPEGLRKDVNQTINVVNNAKPLADETFKAVKNLGDSVIQSYTDFDNFIKSLKIPV